MGHSRAICGHFKIGLAASFRLPKIGIADRGGDRRVIRYQKFYFSILEKIFGKFYRKITPPHQYNRIRKNLGKFVGKCIICIITLYYNFFWKIPIPPYYIYLKKFYRKILVNLTINWYLIKKLGDYY